jgi:iron(III) transport system substrate-binding protein
MLDLSPKRPDDGDEKKTTAVPDESPEREEAAAPSEWRARLSMIIAGLPRPATRQDRRLVLSLVTALGLLIMLPFLLRLFSNKPTVTSTFSSADETLVILSPHNETIRREISTAFRRWYEERTGKTVQLDWRTPGGTSEIAKVIDSEYLAAFQRYWRTTTGQRWERGLTKAFVDPKFNELKAGEFETAEHRARQAFLSSDLGIGIDLFFGGGMADFERQRKKGTLVPQDKSGAYGPAALRKAQPTLFSEAVIPAVVGGEPFYAADLSWVGTCLSSFGIIYNEDVVRRLGIEKPPTSWRDLADPRYRGQIAVADPTKGGSVVKAFEMIIQQEMRAALIAAKAEIEATPLKQRPERERKALNEGWMEGLRLIQRIGANARFFTDTSTKVPRDVADGIAAAGMCIDFFGRTYEEKFNRTHGASRVKFVSPLGGTSTGVDAIGMFRGAPHPATAHAFIDFILSPAGQKLWNYRVGAPGGPVQSQLRRLPIRRDFYTAEHLPQMTDAEVMPYDRAHQFVYEPSWTSESFDTLRLLVRVMCIDTHEELVTAWNTLAEKNFPPEATARLGDLTSVASEDTTRRIGEIMRSGDKLAQVRQARDFGAIFRRQYKLATTQAENSRPTTPTKPTAP